MFPLLGDRFSVRFCRLADPAHGVYLTNDVDVEGPALGHLLDYVDVGVVKATMHHVEGHVGDPWTTGKVTGLALHFVTLLARSVCTSDWVGLVQVVALVIPCCP